MSELELMALIDSYKEHILNDDAGGMQFRERMLLGLCRDIERETLRNAVRGMRAAVNAVDDRVNVRKVLIEYENNRCRTTTTV